MKLFRISALVVAIAVVAGAANLDHQITLRFKQSFANNLPCDQTVTTSCISGFSEGILDVNGNQVQLATDTPAACSGPQPEQCQSIFNSQLPIGMDTFYVATKYVDKNGAAGVTAPTLSAPQTVAADSPFQIIPKIK